MYMFKIKVISRILVSLSSVAQQTSICFRKSHLYTGLFSYITFIRMCIAFRHLVIAPTALTRGLAFNGLIQVRNVPSYLRHAWGTGDLSRMSMEIYA